MSEPLPAKTPLESIRSNANAIREIATQLEATARLLSRVPSTDDEDDRTSAHDLAAIMSLFADHQASIEDLAGGIEGEADELISSPNTRLHE